MSFTRETHRRDMVMRYSSLLTTMKSMEASAKLIQGCPGTMVSRVLALEVSQMWCCSRYVSRVVLPGREANHQKTISD
jgi:hypothetical protein